MGSNPGIGTSSLAKLVATEMNAELINPDTILSATMTATSDSTIGDDGIVETMTGFEKGIFDTLIAGRELDTSLFLEYYPKLVSSNDAQYRGIVLEGLPYNSAKITDPADTSESTEPVTSFPDLKVLETCIAMKPPHFKLVLVNLIMPEDDLCTRRAAQWIDPMTGVLYCGAQVEYSKRRRAEGWVDGTPDTLYEEAWDEEMRTWDFEVAEPVKKAVGEFEEEGGEIAEDEEEEEEDENDGDGSEGKKRKRTSEKDANGVRFDLSNKKVWVILQNEVLGRLVKRPEDATENLSVDFAGFQRKKPSIEALKRKYFDSMHTINLDARQHPDILLRNAMNRLAALGFSLLRKPVSTKKLEIAPGFFSGMTQQDIYTYLMTLDVEPGEPQREESSWGHFCPVKFYEQNTLVHTGFEIPVSYRGCFYFLSDEHSYNQFVGNPDKYLEIPPTLMGVNLCVLGGPFTGKTAQSKMLAQIYNLKYISADEMLSEWDSDPNQRELKKSNKRYAEIVERCRTGQSVAPETMIELILIALRNKTPDLGGNSSGSRGKKSTGWIIDGFPRTIDEARAMVSAGLSPDYVVLLSNDINDERVRMRSKVQWADSKSGLPWTGEKAMKKPTTASLIPHPPSKPLPPTVAALRSSVVSRARSSTTKRTPPASSINARSTPKSLKANPAIRAISRQSGRNKHSRGDLTGSVSEIPTRKPAVPVDDMPNLPVVMFPYFDNLYNGFKEELADIVKLLETKSKLMETGAEQSIPTILAIIQSAIDSFLPKAKEISEKQLGELGFFEMGSTKDFCPFALRQVNVLRKGNPQYAVKYLSQIYYLSNEEAKYAFLMEPHNFADVRNLMNPPPPRFFFLGPQGAGKSVCMKSLEHWGAPVLRFEDYIYEYAKTAEKSDQEEIEYMMRENAGVLSPILIEDIVSSLFKREPYATKGFLLEGFPRTKADAEVVVKHNLHIDAVVVLRIDSEVAAKRIMHEKKKDALASKREASAILAVNPNDKRALESLTNADLEIKRLQDHEADLFDDLVSSVDKGNMRVSDAVSSFENAWQVPIIEIDCNKCLRPMIGSLKRQCVPFFENRPSLLSNALKIEFREAEMLLRLGVKSYSPFEKICPVSLKKNSSVLKRHSGSKPVLFRDHIYYLRTEEYRDEFVNNIQEYISQTPPQPAVRPQIAILGRPKCGKTTGAARISKEYDLVHLTIPTIINSILQGNENISLSKKITQSLHAGECLPEDVILEAVLLVTSRAVCMARGWVLDGYPQTIHQAMQLEAFGVIPHVVFHLNLDETSMYQRTDNEMRIDIRSKTPHLNFAGVTRERNEIHAQNVTLLKSMYKGTYENWIEIDGSKSKWYVKNELVRYLEGATKRRQNYTDLKSKGMAAPVHDIGINIPMIEEHLSKFGQYCPVKMLDNGELAFAPRGTDYTAEFDGQFFKMSEKEYLALFLQNPEKYAFGPELPESLPERKSASALVFPKHLELQGYCPVTLADGPSGFDSIVPGNLNYIVEYEERLFAFESEEKLGRFMKMPWAFANLELPKKLPPKIVQIPVGQLPIIGYLEQSVARSLTDAMTEVGKSRPKHPYKSLSASASEYISYYLKSKNPRSKVWIQEKHSKNLERFLDRCALISEISTLAKGSSFMKCYSLRTASYSDDGTRMVPLRIMDVAGLVPRASTGEGLGNQFLDDSGTADLLIHVVDASGTTDAAGKVGIGYDPINDINSYLIRMFILPSIHYPFE
ncbi:adenylate kinase [Chytriomyces hyalinus]|nr:adenylate kinase [Chytriomyces hyalinus]